MLMEEEGPQAMELRPRETRRAPGRAEEVVQRRAGEVGGDEVEAGKGVERRKTAHVGSGQYL
jgi:hypothetical protein